MPVPPQRDPRQTRDRLAAWVAARHPGARDVWVSEVSGPTATGYSHETILFDAAWTEEGGRREERLAARVAPTGYSVFLEPDFAAEYRVIHALAGGSGVPLPRAHGYEEDASYLGAPFCVVDRIEGEIPPDNPPYTFGGWLADAAPADQERAWWSGVEALAAVHGADPGALGLEFLARPRYGEPGLDEQLGYWEAYLAGWAGAPRPPPSSMPPRGSGPTVSRMSASACAGATRAWGT